MPVVPRADASNPAAHRVFHKESRMLTTWPLALACLCSLVEPTLEQKIQAVLPTPAEERWLQIPWRTHLEQARAEAQREQKPLFLWIMNGHPFGCT